MAKNVAQGSTVHGGIVDTAISYSISYGIVGVISTILGHAFPYQKIADFLGGEALANFAGIIFVGVPAVLWLLFRRYYRIIGASKRSHKRKIYDALRKRLATGGMVAAQYARRLTRFLDGIDRFFGDAGMQERTLFPHAFGLKTPAPLWTATSFDRCLLLALIYPIATIFVIWAISGHGGTTEQVLGLKRDAAGWLRAIAVAGLAVGIYGVMKSAKLSGWKETFWLCVSFGGFGMSAYESGAFAAIFLYSVVGVFAWSIAVSEPEDFQFARENSLIGITLIALGLYLAIAFATYHSDQDTWFLINIGHSLLRALILAFTMLVGAAAVALLTWLITRLTRYHWQGIALALLVASLIVGCFAVARLTSSIGFAVEYRVVIMFFVLLTLLNAPFVWISLGLTRALLRRGLELGGLWPYGLALVDAILSGIIVICLSFAMVIGVQAFDALAMRGGGTSILNAVELLKDIENTPTAPQYWWVYALLLSTMISSVVNLAIAGFSLLRGWPGLTSYLLNFMPAGKAVPEIDRSWVAVLLALQLMLGILLGIAAQALLAFGIWHVMQWVGFSVLGIAMEVAALDIPGRFFRLLF